MHQFTLTLLSSSTSIATCCTLALASSIRISNQQLIRPLSTSKMSPPTSALNPIKEKEKENESDHKIYSEMSRNMKGAGNDNEND